MPLLDAVNLGVLLLVLGAGFFLITRLLLPAAVRLRPQIKPADPLTAGGSNNLDVHDHALLTVEPGGRLAWLNSRACTLFRVTQGELPDLERLARRIRPSEQFLQLCAAEGQARFVLESQTLQGVSYWLQTTPNPLMLVTLSTPEISSDLSNDGLTSQTLQTYTELTQEMAASLDLKDTLQAILTNVEKLIPADFMEVNILDAESEVLLPYRFVGLPGIQRQVEASSDRYRLDDGYSGYLAQNRVPLLVPDVELRHDLRPTNRLSGAFPLRSYVGVPLLVGKEMIGTLELGSLTPDAFQQEDLDVLHLLSGQAGIAVHNALLYRGEQRRAAELSGLAQLAHAFGSVRDPKGMYGRLLQSIAPLVSAQIVGFLIYNETQHTLEGQVPFHGLPPQFIDLYHAPVQPNSPAEHILLDQDVLISDNAAEDQHWEDLGLIHLAQAASLRDTVLVPLTSGGRMLGYLQVSNHTDGSTIFTQEELHLLMIIANQAAPIIENATLVQQSRLRAQRAEALRRISSLTTSTATLNEILLFSLQELARLLQADLATVFLLDKARALLVNHADSMYGDLPVLPEALSRLGSEDPQYHFTATGRQHAFTSGKLAEEQAIIPFYQQLISYWQLGSIIVVPLITRDEGIGEIWLGSKRAGFFDQGDTQTVATAAGQLAGVVEQSNLSTQTDESLRRRIEQLTALMRISRELSTSLDLKSLLQLVYDEALRTTHASCGSILLFDLGQPEDSAPQIRDCVGDGVSGLSDFELNVLRTGEVMNISDVRQAGFSAAHGDVRSALVAPIVYRQRPAGLIVLHSLELDGFDHFSVEIIQSLVSQTAVALSNASQYEDQLNRTSLLKRQLEMVNKLFDVSQALRPDHTLEEALSEIAGAIADVTPFQVVLLSVYQPEQDGLQRLAHAGLSQQVWDDARAAVQPWRSIQELMRPEYKIGNAYYIPADRRPMNPKDLRVVPVTQPAVSGQAAYSSEPRWTADDLLFVPFYDVNGDPLGLLSLDAPRDGRRPDQPTFEALELLSAQASQMIENRRDLLTLQLKLEENTAEQRRRDDAASHFQQSLPVLLHKELEQTIATQGLQRQLWRMQAGMEISDLAAQPSMEGGKAAEPLRVLNAVAREMITRFEFQVVLLAENTPAGARLLETVGSIYPGNPDRSSNPQALFGQRNPLRQIVQDGQMLFVSNLETEREWLNNPLLNSLGARSLVGLPIEAGEEHRYALLAVSQKTVPPFSVQDRQIYAQLARQISVSLQNLHLMGDTRRRLQEVNLLLDYTRKLSSLDPANILNALTESILQVIPDANAAWVALWDRKTRQLVPQVGRGYTDEASLRAIRYPVLDDAKSSPSLPVRAYLSGQPLRVPEVQFVQDYNLSPDDLLKYRQATAGRLPVSSMVLPMRLGDEVLGVLVLDNFSTLSAFNDEEEALAMTITQQTALAMENASLFQTAGQRAAQLQSLTDAAGMLASNLNRQELLSSLLGKLSSVLPFQTATLWLRQGNQLSVAAAAGFSDNERRLGLAVAVEDSTLFQDMIRSGKALSVPDVREDARFTSLITPDYLSWLGVPLVAKSQLVGLIALEKTESDYYTPEHIQAATTFASQAAVALENARLFEEGARRSAELEIRSQRMALLNRLSSELGSSLDVDYILKLTAQQLLNAFDPSLEARVAAVLNDDLGRFVLRTEVPSWRPQDGDWKDLPQSIPDCTLLDQLRESMGIFNTDDVSREVGLRPLYIAYLQPRAVSSLLILPLAAGSNHHGWFLLQTARNYRFNPSEIELARTISNQASIAIQNARQFAETRRLALDLEKRVEERTADVVREHRNSQTMLRIITELSASLDIGQVLTRAMGVLNESLGSEQSLILLTQDKGRPYQSGAALVNVNQVELEKQIGRWVVRHRAATLVNDVLNDERWTIPAETKPAYCSVVAVPLTLGEEILGTLLLFHHQRDYFALEQVGLIETAARQISITLNNSDLFNLIRDQSEHLGSMLRDQQIEATRSRAILEAVADGVLVTDAGSRITLFNASAERVLGLPNDQAMGKSLEQLAGLFGKAARTWMNTIRLWSQDPKSFTAGETYAEQISLDNDHVVSVHLSPVIWRSEFLGTVSIFRDITHEVQVDRLKSEFVANVSHELRTPMTSIKGYVEIMLMGASGAITPQQKHFLEVVKSNTERLGVLVNDLLDVSRIEAGRVTLSLQALGLREIAEDVATDVHRRAQEENKPMAIEVEIPAGLPQVSGDLERVRQVLNNLVTNGYNYTPAGGRVVIRMSVVDSEVQIDVQDNGIGIAKEDQARIFQRFYRGEDPLVLATAGTGLGLSIAKTLVEMHHGRIWFSSSGVSGEGSTFSFTLPIYEPEE